MIQMVYIKFIDYFYFTHIVGSTLLTTWVKFE